ncbi:hypothetical protein D3C85_1248270 [compost metagenome]
MIEFLIAWIRDTDMCRERASTAIEIFGIAKIIAAGEFLIWCGGRHYQRSSVTPPSHQFGGEQFLRVLRRQILESLGAFRNQEAVEQRHVLVEPAKDRIRAVASQFSRPA